MMSMQFTLMTSTLFQDLMTRPSRYVWEKGEREKGGEGGRGEDEGGGEQVCTHYHHGLTFSLLIVVIE